MKPDRDRCQGRGSSFPVEALSSSSTTLDRRFLDDFTSRDLSIATCVHDRSRAIAIARGPASTNTPACLVIYTRWDDGSRQRDIFLPSVQKRRTSVKEKKKKKRLDRCQARLCGWLNGDAKWSNRDIYCFPTDTVIVLYGLLLLPETRPSRSVHPAILRYAHNAF